MDYFFLDNRSAQLLRKISTNIVPFDPVRDNLLDLIEDALKMPKGMKSFNKQLYSEPQTQSLESFIDAVLSGDGEAAHPRRKLSRV